MITHEELKKVLSYDPNTGLFVWLRITGNRAKVGSIAGANSKGYVVITINNIRYHAHQLAWFYITGHWAPHHIDHINRNPSDNRFSNLRPATHRENLFNRGPNKNNKIGLKGVSKYRNKYSAQIHVSGKKNFLGYYLNPEDAHKAYCLAAEKYFGEFRYKESV
jgi:hypothetical protein